MKKFNTQIKALIQAKDECARFIEKADLAIKRLESEDGCYSTKEMASARRSAMDVRREMTVINQLTMWT